MKKRTRAALSSILFGDVQAEVRNVQIASFIPTERYIQKLIVGIEPVQDLHGYDSPWPSGGGKNLTSYDTPYVCQVGVNNQTLLFSLDLKGGTTYTFSCKQSATIPTSTRNSLMFGKSGGPYQYENTQDNYNPPDLRHQMSVTPSEDGTYSFLIWNHTPSVSVMYDEWQVEESASFTSYAPYSNICPITGWSAADIFREASYDPTASPYVTVSFGQTVYGGTLDVLKGKLYARPYYSSYNGETLVGPWISSMDKYEEGGTPTTGAEVLDMGGTITEITLTPTQIATLQHQVNHVWADCGPIIELIS